MADTIQYLKEDMIGRIILNDPDRLNALSLKMAKEFRTVVNEIRRDEGLRCVILSGAGRAFSAGGNLDMIGEKKLKTAEQNQKEMLEFYGDFLAIRSIEVPTIAALNGHAIGAGFCVALACDLRLAADTAKVGVNFTKLGLSPGMAGSWLISQLAGLATAIDLLFTGRTLVADEARQLGLLHQVLPADRLAEAVHELALAIAANGPVAIRETKRILYANAQLTLDDSLLNEAHAQSVCFHTEDLQEGVAAIREKRTPKFAGK